MSETVKVEAGARHGRPNVKIAALPLAAISDMHADARVRNEKTDAELAELLATELRIKAPDNSYWKLSISNTGVISQTNLP